MGKRAFPENGEGWELGGVTKRKEQCLVNSAAWGASSFPPHMGTGWMADLRGPSGKRSLNQLASEMRSTGGDLRHSGDCAGRGCLLCKWDLRVLGELHNKLESWFTLAAGRRRSLPGLSVPRRDRASPPGPRAGRVSLRDKPTPGSG